MKREKQVAVWFDNEEYGAIKKGAEKEKTTMADYIRRALRTVTHSKGLRLAKSNEGFTLVEILVAITILAIIMAIMFEIFGNPFKKASLSGNSSQIFEQFRQVEDAAAQYSTLQSRDATSMSDLISGGVLKSLPNPAQSAKEAANTYTSGYVMVMATQYPAGTTITGFGQSGTDTVLYLEGVTQDICDAIDTTYGVKAASDAIPSAINYTKSLQCFGAAPNFVVLAPVYVN